MSATRRGAPTHKGYAPKNHVCDPIASHDLTFALACPAPPAQRHPQLPNESSLCRKSNSDRRVATTRTTWNSRFDSCALLRCNKLQLGSYVRNFNFKDSPVSRRTFAIVQRLDRRVDWRKMKVARRREVSKVVLAAKVEWKTFIISHLLRCRATRGSAPHAHARCVAEAGVADAAAAVDDAAARLRRAQTNVGQVAASAGGVEADARER